MKVLILSPHGENLVLPLTSSKDDAIMTNEHVSVPLVKSIGAELIISYGYYHLISDDVISSVGGQVIDLHISFLPWNRGADPHFWSFFDGTPKGVSIYRILNSRLDGELLARREVSFTDGETLSSTHQMLHRQVESLFADVWPELRAGRLAPIPQATAGTFHHTRDKDLFFAMLRQGWDTPVHAVEMLGRRFRGLSTAPTPSVADGGVSG